VTVNRNVFAAPFAALAFAALGLGRIYTTMAAAPASTATVRTMSQVLADSKPSDWRPLDPARTLYLELAQGSGPGASQGSGPGRVIIELAPQFAPNHVANILTMVRTGYFDGLAVMRVQDNYVAQWGDADGKRPVGDAKNTLVAEFDRPSAGLPFMPLPDADTYAPEVGFSDGFPVARDPSKGRAWMTHCYGTVGAGRDTDADSGGGKELYAVIGHSPRHLDRNVTLVGRVVKGIDVLSSLPRGTGDLGFYEKAEQRVPIRTVRVMADVPKAERTPLEVLRTDTPTFKALVESRRNRTDEWFKYRAGRVEICNVPIPVRTPPTN
jgi:peptidylprolyl isomerase